MLLDLRHHLDLDLRRHQSDGPTFTSIVTMQSMKYLTYLNLREPERETHNQERVEGCGLRA